MYNLDRRSIAVHMYTLLQSLRKVAILANVSHMPASMLPFFRSCSHAFTLLAACTNAARGNFVRSCLATAFFRLFVNAVDDIAPSMQGDGRVWCVRILAFVYFNLFFVNFN